MEVHFLLRRIYLFIYSFIPLFIYSLTYFTFTYLLRSKKERKQKGELWAELRSVRSKFTIPHNCLSDIWNTNFRLSNYHHQYYLRLYWFTESGSVCLYHVLIWAASTLSSMYTLKLTGAIQRKRITPAKRQHCQKLLQKGNGEHAITNI